LIPEKKRDSPIDQTNLQTASERGKGGRLREISRKRDRENFKIDKEERSKKREEASKNLKKEEGFKKY
jgi:hypothetical protein